MTTTTDATIAVKELTEGDIIEVDQYANALEVTHTGELNGEENAFIGLEFAEDSKKTSAEKSMVVNQNSGRVYLSAGTTDKGEVETIKIVSGFHVGDRVTFGDSPIVHEVSEIEASGAITLENGETVSSHLLEPAETDDEDDEDEDNGTIVVDHTDTVGCLECGFGYPAEDFDGCPLCEDDDDEDEDDDESVDEDLIPAGDVDGQIIHEVAQEFGMGAGAVKGALTFHAPESEDDARTPADEAALEARRRATDAAREAREAQDDLEIADELVDGGVYQYVTDDTPEVHTFRADWWGDRTHCTLNYKDGYVADVPAENIAEQLESDLILVIDEPEDSDDEDDEDDEDDDVVPGDIDRRDIGDSDDETGDNESANEFDRYEGAIFTDTDGVEIGRVQDVYSKEDRILFDIRHTGDTSATAYEAEQVLENMERDRYDVDSVELVDDESDDDTLADELRAADVDEVEEVLDRHDPREDDGQRTMTDGGLTIACTCGGDDIEYSHGEKWRCNDCGRFHDIKEMERLADRARGQRDMIDGGEQESETDGEQNYPDPERNPRAYEAHESAPVEVGDTVLVHMVEGAGFCRGEFPLEYEVKRIDAPNSLSPSRNDYIIRAYHPNPPYMADGLGDTVILPQVRRGKSWGVMGDDR